jgi:hypothetical protein
MYTLYFNGKHGHGIEFEECTEFAVWFQIGGPGSELSQWNVTSAYISDIPSFKKKKTFSDWLFRIPKFFVPQVFHRHSQKWYRISFIFFAAFLVNL